MEMILIKGGGTAYRRYVNKQKRDRGFGSPYPRMIKTKSKKTGQVTSEHIYYYALQRRPEDEITAMVEEGRNPRHANVLYKEVYIGKEPPANFDDEITMLKYLDKIVLDGEDLITDEKTYNTITSLKPDLFKDLTLYQLKRGDRNDNN